MTFKDFQHLGSEQSKDELETQLWYIECSIFGSELEILPPTVKEYQIYWGQLEQIKTYLIGKDMNCSKIDSAEIFQTVLIVHVFGSILMQPYPNSV